MEPKYRLVRDSLGFYSQVPIEPETPLAPVVPPVPAERIEMSALSVVGEVPKRRGRHSKLNSEFAV